MNIQNISIAFVFALLPALGWLFIYYKKDKKDPEPKKVILLTFLVGTLIGLIFVGLKLLTDWLNISHLLVGSLASVIVFAALEEIAKLSAAIFVVSKYKLHFNQIIDGVVYAVTAALGFAFIENAFYIFTFLKQNSSTSDFLSLIAFRSLGTMLAHTLFSGLAGLIWAYAHFSKKISPFHKKSLLAFEWKDWINREILSLHIIRENILKARPSRRGGHEKKILVLEGLVLAIFLHVIFNLLTTLEVLGKSLTFLLVPALIGGFLYISYLFTKKKYSKIYKVI